MGALPRAEALLERLVESAHDAIVVLDQEVRVTRWNAAAERIFGRTRDEMIGADLFDVLAPVPALGEARARFARFLRAEGDTAGGRTLEVTARRADGSEIPVEMSISAVRLDGAWHVLGIVRDLSERKRAQEALERSDQLRKLALKIGQVGAFDADLETGKASWTAEIDRIWGLPPGFDGDLPAFCWTLVHPDDLARTRDGYREAVKSGAMRMSEFRIVRPDGEVRCIRWLGQVIADERTGARRFVGVNLDVTEAKRAEVERAGLLRFFEGMDRVSRALQATNNIEEAARCALDVVLSILDCDRASLIYPCDPEAENWTVPIERTRPEYPGVLALGLDLPIESETKDVFRALLESRGPVSFGQDPAMPLPGAVAAEFGIQSQLAMAIFPKGRRPWMFVVHQCSHPRVWSPEDVRLFEAIGHRLGDSLTNLLAFRELRESELRLRTLVETIPDLVWLKDPQGVYLSCNPQFERLYGASEAEIVGKTDDAFVSREMADFFRRHDRRAMAVGGPIRNEEWLTFADGGYRGLFETVKTPMVDAGGSLVGVLGVARDISERKAAEDELRATRDEIHRLNAELEARVRERTQQLEAASLDLESFSYSVSHDLRTPLRAIDGYAALLAEEYEPHFDAEALRLFARIRENAQRMGRLIDGILDFSRAGRVSLALADLEMASLAREAWQGLEPRWQGRAVELRIHELPQAAGDAVAVRQIFENLLGNALKFTRSRELAVIEVGGERSGEEVTFYVRDNGEGYDPAFATNLFGLFHRLHRLEEVEGTGVGLAIVKRFVEKLGGRVWTEGRPGEGATFWFTLQPPNGRGRSIDPS